MSMLITLLCLWFLVDAEEIVHGLHRRSARDGRDVVRKKLRIEAVKNMIRLKR